MDNIVYLSLGSNMGNRYENLKSAIYLLRENKRIRLVKSSSIYETEPVGYVDQDLFLNMVIEIKTDVTPMEMLDICMKTEEKLGRKRIIKWGPRIIDLDILLYNQENIKTKDLLIPHPRMFERAFVLVPLIEVKPDIKNPKTGKPLNFYLKDILNRGGVRIWKQKNGEDVFALFEN